MSKFTLDKLSFNEQDGKDIADFLARYFHAEHSLDGGKSPKIHWGKTSWQINNVLLKGIVYVVRKNKNIIGTLGLKECSHWWSDDAFIGDTWFFVRPEFRNVKDAISSITNKIKDVIKRFYKTVIFKFTEMVRKILKKDIILGIDNMGLDFEASVSFK